MALPPPYAAALVAFVLFLPFLLWQWANSWPTLEFIRSASQKNPDLTLLQFLTAHLVATGSVSIEHWTVGKPRLWRRYGVVGFVATSALLKLPLGIPLLPIESFFTYSRAIMGDRKRRKNQHRQDSIGAFPPDVGRTEIVRIKGKIVSI